MANESPKIEILRVLGVPISIVDLDRATTVLVRWAENGTQAYQVFVREVASLMLTVKQKGLMELHETANLIVPDGTPLVWIGKMRGHGRRIGRVAGADLVDRICERSLAPGHSHYFYGGKPGVAKKMAEALAAKYAGLRVAGYQSPPLFDLHEEKGLIGFDEAAIAAIAESGAHFVWVGISSPKQEHWIARAASLLDRGVLIGVGAAFDFHSGEISRAPHWMRNYGFEWLHRLWSEPRRLWYRYLVLAPQFALRAIAEVVFKRV